MRKQFRIILITWLSASTVNAANELDESAKHNFYPQDPFTFELYYRFGKARVPKVGYRPVSTQALPGYSDPHTTREADPREARTYGELSLGLQWERNRFFLEARKGKGESREAAGFHFVRNQTKNLTLVLKKDRNIYQPWIKQGYEGTGDRLANRMLGLQQVMQLGQNQLALDLYTDIRRGDGNESSLSFHRYWDYGQWQITGSVGLSYTSSGINNYYIGVSPSQVAELAPQYKASSAINVNVHLNFVHPLSGKWEFRTQAYINRYDDSIVNSPLVKGRIEYHFAGGLFYVFKNK